MTLSKIDKLGIGDWLISQHNSGKSDLELADLIWEKYKEKIPCPVIYRYIKRKLGNHKADNYKLDDSINDPDFQLDNQKIINKIDFSKIDRIVDNPVFLASTSQEILLKTFLKLAMIIDARMSLINNSDGGRLPEKEIKLLKSLTEILAIMTNRPYDKKTIIEIKNSLLGENNNISNYL